MTQAEFRQAGSGACSISGLNQGRVGNRLCMCVFEYSTALHRGELLPRPEPDGHFVHAPGGGGVTATSPAPCLMV